MLGRKRSSLHVRLWRRWIPELDLFEPNESDRAFRRARGGWQPFLLGAPLAVGGYVTARYLESILHSMFTLPRLIVSSITTLLWVGFVFWLVWLTRARIRRKLREELINRGFAICGPCGYDLRGLTESRCPECGSPFDKKLLNDDEP